MPAPLIDAVLDLLIFLELSPEAVVDPDAAVAAMESATASLQQLAPEQRLAFVARANERASREHRDEVRRFLSSVGEAAGLIER
jgi:hypothetical protein